MSTLRTPVVHALVVGIDRNAGLGPAVADACARAGLEPLFEGETDKAPRLIVGVLPSSSRLLPDEVIRLGDRYPEAGVILVCAETLVRPTVSLQRGRVLLLSPPHDVESLSRRIRQAVWTVKQGGYLDTARGLSESASTVRSQVRVSERFWAGLLSTYSADAETMRTATSAPLGRNVVMGLHTERGFAEASTLLEAGSLSSAARGFGGLPESSQELVSLAEGLSPECSIVGLYNASDWVIAATNPAVHVWLVSPLRFPSAFSISARMRKLQESVVALPARAGDVLIALVHQGVPDAATAAAFGPDSEALRVALSSGGVGVQDSLRATFSSAGAGRAALALEVI